MTRPESRERARQIQKQVKGFSVGEMEKFLCRLFENSAAEMAKLVEAELREGFGFGDKRIDRLRKGVNKRAAARD